MKKNILKRKKTKDLMNQGNFKISSSELVFEYISWSLNVRMILSDGDNPITESDGETFTYEFWGEYKDNLKKYFDKKSVK